MTFFDKNKKIVCLLGEFALFCGYSFKACLWTLKKRYPLFLQNCEFIGLNTLPITTLAAIFLGAVLSYQLYISLHQFQAEALIGGTVGVTLFRELAPVIAGTLIIGRVGATMAAHLATQRINEQIDALEVIGIDPFEYLIAPKILASMLMIPFVVLFFAITASFSAYFVAIYVMNLQSSIFIHHYIKTINFIDLVHCFTKSLFFSWIIGCTSCFFGLRAHGGAQAVGYATRNTVIFSTLIMLLSDYLLTAFLPVGLTKLTFM